MCFSDNDLSAELDLTCIGESDIIKLLFSENAGVVLQSKDGSIEKVLEENGIEVISGVCKEKAEDLIAPFKKLITKSLPYITLKLAITIDGKIFG